MGIRRQQIMLLFLVALCPACSKDQGPSVDTIPPAAVHDLALVNLDSTTATLAWTATGDDSLAGPASVYDMRYFTAPFDESGWQLATQCTGEPTPQSPGSEEVFIVGGLTNATTYYFALKVADETYNWSTLSNLLHATTREPCSDCTPPAAVNDLEAAAHDAERINLRWTAPGDGGHEGVAEEYDIRVYSSEIDASNWGAATRISGEPDPAPAGTVQTLMVSGLAAGDHYFAIRTRDEEPDSLNWSDLSNSAHIRVANCPWGTPAMTTDFFKVEEISPGRVRLIWFLCASCSYYTEGCDIRYSTAPIDDWNWESTQRCPGHPSVVYDGHHWVYANFEYVISGLAPSTTYYVGVRADDGACVSHAILATITTGSAEK